VPISLRVAESQITPALGLMVVGFDNQIGDPQARVIPVPVPAPASAMAVPSTKRPSSTAKMPTGAADSRPNRSAANQR
jgi:hypothetical protein